ncbi:MAG: class I SAM-dependent methyltransferase [Candidatus Coatesbacteria bacterium]
MTDVDYGRLAADYSKYRQVHPEVFRALAGHSNVDAGSKVLEVGCGTGNYIIALQERTGCAAWGGDPAPKMLEVARSRSGSVAFSAGTAEEPGVAEGGFDLIFTVDVIHHVRDRMAYFAKALGLLRPGGRICTVTDDREIILSRKPLTNYFPETVPYELERYPLDGEIQGLMRKAGFRGIAEERVLFEADLTDISLWRNKACSSLHLIPDEAFRKGLARMDEDLRKGPIRWVSPYLLIWGKK